MTALTWPPHLESWVALTFAVILTAFAIAPCSNPQYNRGVRQVVRNGIFLLIAAAGTIAAVARW